MTSVRTRILLFFTLFATASLAAVIMSGRSTRKIGAVANSVVHRHLPIGEVRIGHPYQFGGNRLAC